MNRSSDGQHLTLLGMLADTRRLEIAQHVMSRGGPVTLSELRGMMGWDYDMNSVKRIRYHVGRMVEAGLLLRKQGAPGKADEYRINPDLAAEILAIIEHVM